MNLHQKFKPKFYVGVSGHRDIDMCDKAEYISHIKGVLFRLCREHPDYEIILITSLAEGADRLAAYAAQEIGMRYEVWLPMPLEMYVQDFDDESLDEFMRLFYGARASDVTPLCNGCTYDHIAAPGKWRSRQYQEAGFALVRRCDHMIFLFDENDAIIHPEIKPGGTADVLRYAKARQTSYDIIPVKRKEANDAKRCREVSCHLS